MSLFIFLTALRLVVLVIVWWLANAITSIASKTEVDGGRRIRGDNRPAFSTTRWLELTTVQFLLGGLASAMYMKFINGQTIRFNTEKNRKEQLMLILGSLLGHLSVNVSYAFVNSSATQVIKSSEPMFMFFLLICFNFQQHRNQLNFSIFLSLVLMALGTCLFVMWDVTFNTWGVLAAVVSNIASPLRNIALKKLDQTYSPLEKYFVLSFYGSLILVPALCVKMAIVGDPVLRLSKMAIPAANFHCVYNIASISVLREISPMNHAILNFAKRIFVIVTNIRYFHTILTWQMSMGLIVVVAGLALYNFLQQKKVHYLALKRMRFAKNACGVLVFLFVATFIHFKHTNNVVRPNGGQMVTTSWLYERPIPANVLENFKALQANISGTTVHVYCGSSECTELIDGLKNPVITTQFLVVPDLLRNTPLEAWFMRHPLNKILHGARFEDQLQEAVQLAHLWHHGGIFIVPTVKTKSDRWPSGSDWVTVLSDPSQQTIPSILDVSHFSPRHSFILALMAKLAKEYLSWENEAKPVRFKEIVWDVYTKYCEDAKRCPTNNGPYIERLGNLESEGRRYHFGTISYDWNVLHVGGGRTNIGDEIQGLPGVQFLPYVDFFLDREEQTVPNSKDNFTLFYNAWWGRSNTQWPPPANIDPIMLSMHLNQAKSFNRVVSKPNSLSFFKRKAPIGCRDTVTKQYLERLGVESFLTGCLTLLIKNPNANKKRTDTIYLVDLNPKLYNMIPVEIRKHTVRISHVTVDDKNDTDSQKTKKRYIYAYDRVEMYSQAKLVITQRIHCAIPSVAMGTPVIFINDKRMPGGGATSTKATDRVKGLTELFHTIDMFTMTLQDIERFFKNFNWSDPPKNPNAGMRMRMVATSWNVIRKRRKLYENAHKFGLLPLTPRWIVGQVQLHFHLVFDGLTSELSWRHLRCIESIFRHHHSSKVIVHSNTLGQSIFDVFTEVGYDIEVKKYNMVDIAQGTTVERFLKKERSSPASGEEHWSDLLRLLLMYKYGGLYMDIDSIVVKPMINLGPNVLGLDSENNVNKAIMRFEKDHPFLEAALQEFTTFYREKSAADKETNLLTKVWKLWRRGAQTSRHVKEVSRGLFYTFNATQVEKECFDDTSGATFEAHMENIKTDAYVVTMHSLKLQSRIEIAGESLKNGTICKHLFNSHCILCNKVY